MKHLATLTLILFLALAAGASSISAQSGPDDKACWGQATKVYAKMGEQGQHTSSQANPRLGLRNLARFLYDQGIIDDDTIQALGVFVSSELGLSIDACM